MRVAIYFTAARLEPGGGYNQAFCTARALSQEVDDVEFIFREGAISDADVSDRAEVHHFISSNPRYAPLMRRIRREKRGLIALSPIFWWTPEVQRCVTPELLPYLRYTLTRYAARLSKHRLARYEVFRLADLVLPNSPAEADLVRKEFPLSGTCLLLPVPNGVTELSSATAREGPREFVLCAGSFNPRKNQLAVIRALKQIAIPVIFLGAPGRRGPVETYQDYYDRCRHEAGPNMQFVDHIPHESEAWLQMFTRARAFVMASACETPSLAALEAGLMGASLVLTRIGSTSEYFGPLATYCHPRNIASIAFGVQRAWAAGPNPSLSSHIAGRFLWRNVARITALSYRAGLLGGGPSLEAYRRLTDNLWFPYNPALC